MSITVRPAEAKDRDVIADFNNRIAKETEDRSLSMDLLRPGVAAVLDHSELGRYFVADLDGRVVGQIMVTYEWSDWRNGMLWWIQSVYVAVDARRNGVFSALYGHVEQLAREEPGVCGIRLYVEAENYRAQQTYRRLGMSDTSYKVMEVDFTEGKHA